MMLSLYRGSYVLGKVFGVCDGAVLVTNVCDNRGIHTVFIFCFHSSVSSYSCM